ncbi:MAG: ankyrin repeat domain-containing protein [Treponema sp.]|jgi:ankyrin repeat protein|nr:ankyrin repeat domain-containing protein [Treponema sp.]
MRKTVWITATLLVSLILTACMSAKTGSAEQSEVFNAADYEAAVGKLSETELNAQDSKGNTILHIAAQRNNADIVMYLLVRGADTTLLNNDQDSAIHVAIKNNSMDAVKVLAAHGNAIFIHNGSGKTALEAGLEKGGDFYPLLLTAGTAGMADAEGRSLVHYLVKDRMNDALDYCIRENLYLSKIDNSGVSPLLLALEDNKDIESIHIAAKLILAGATPVRGNYAFFEEAVLTRNPSLRFDDGQTPLHFAAIQGQTGIVRYLLERGASVSAQDTSGSSPLHEAVRYGRVEVVSLLLEKGANPNALDSLGKTPLLLIIPRGTQHEIYSLLMEKGSNPAAKDTYGDTSLHIAIMNNVDVSIFSKLAGARIDINERNKQGITPLALAVEHGKIDIASYLVERGADIHAKDVSGLTPLIRTFTVSPDMLSLLITSKTISVRDSAGNTPLHIGVLNVKTIEPAVSKAGGNPQAKEESKIAGMPAAASDKNTAKKDGDSTAPIRYLLNMGADINARNDAGDTPIFLAIQNNQRVTGELLLASGAAVFSGNANNMSPLGFALSFADGSRDWVLIPEVIKTVDGSGNTALHYAAEWKNDRAVSLILELGGNANAKNANGETPVFNAVKVNSPTTIQLLVKNGSSKDSWDAYGNTPLHTSVFWDASESASCLIKLGVDINAKNSAGRTALGEAARTGKNRMTNLLLSSGSDINAADATGKTVLIDAILNGNVEIVRMLINYGASPQIQEMHGRNAYHEAAASGNVEMINMVRNAGGNSLAKDTQGQTPFSIVLNKTPELIKAVLGSDTNLIDSDGNTPVHIAVEGKATADTISLLISMGYPLNRRNRFGVTPLMLAISEKNNAATVLLLQNGSDPYIADNVGECALSAALKGKSEVLNNIVRLAGNRTDIRGDGVLHYAAQIADSETIRKLLSMGLDKSVKNISGETPYDVAVRWQKGDVARLLQ